MKYVYAPKLSFESERLYPQVSLRSNYETEVTLFFFSLRTPITNSTFCKIKPVFLYSQQRKQLHKSFMHLFAYIHIDPHYLSAMKARQTSTTTTTLTALIGEVETLSIASYVLPYKKNSNTLWSIY